MDMTSDAKPIYRWMRVDLENDEFPRNVMRVGREEDGDDIFLGRGYYSNDLLPAKVVPARREAYVSYGNNEIKITKCEVLLAKVDFDWKYATNGNVPANAFKAGVTADGEVLYVGRVEHNNCVFPGKIQPSLECCYFSYDGKEFRSQKYECLIENCHFPSSVKKTYEWKELDLKAEEFPRNVLRVGRDLGGQDIYLGRANYGGDLLPAKVVPARREAYVPFGNKEVQVNKCEVLIVRTHFDWRWARDGHLPENAFKVGLTEHNEALYVGRVEHNNSVTPGKIQPSLRACFYPFGGQELRATGYECLVHHYLRC